MKRVTEMLAILLATGALSACEIRTKEAPVALAAPAPEELRARTTAFSRAIVDASDAGWSAEAVARIANFYATNTVVFPPRGEPLRGRAALITYWSRSRDRKILSHAAVAERIDVADNLATEWGTLSITSQQGSAAPVKGSATYISIWVREEGVWRKQMDTWW